MLDGAVCDEAHAAPWDRGDDEGGISRVIFGEGGLGGV